MHPQLLELLNQLDERRCMLPEGLVLDVCKDPGEAPVAVLGFSLFPPPH